MNYIFHFYVLLFHARLLSSFLFLYSSICNFFNQLCLENATQYLSCPGCHIWIPWIYQYFLLCYQTLQFTSTGLNRLESLATTFLSCQMTFCSHSRFFLLLNFFFRNFSLSYNLGEGASHSWLYDLPWWRTVQMTLELMVADSKSCWIANW